MLFTKNAHKLAFVITLFEVGILAIRWAAYNKPHLTTVPY